MSLSLNENFLKYCCAAGGLDRGRSSLLHKQHLKPTMKSNNTPAKIIESIQEFYNGRDPEEIYNALEIDKNCFDNWIRDFGSIANELLELRDENDNLRTMFTNLSLVNQSLRNSLDSLTRTDSKIFELLLKKRGTGNLSFP